MFIIPKNSENLIKTVQYQALKKIVETFIQTSNPAAFSGNCVATSDILQTLLFRHGIKSRIIECQASVFKIESAGRVNYMFIGYDNYSYPGQIDTHTVVVTEDEHPILIDLSLGYVLPAHKKYLMALANLSIDPKEKIICEVQFDDYEIVYYEKTSLRLPNIHQKNLMQRILNEQRIENYLDFIKKMLYLSLTLSIINFFLNAILIIIKLIND